MRKGFLVPHRGTLARLRRARLGVGAVKKAGIFFFGEGFASVAARVPRCEELQSFALQNSRKKQDSLASSARSALKERAEEAGFPASSLSSALRNSYPYGIPRRSAAKLLLHCFPRFRTRRLKTSVMTEAGRWDDTGRQFFFCLRRGLRGRRQRTRPLESLMLPQRNLKAPHAARTRLTLATCKKSWATAHDFVRGYCRGASPPSAGIPPGVARRCRGEASALLLSSLPYTSVEDLRDDGSGKVGRYKPSGFFSACGREFCLRRGLRGRRPRTRPWESLMLPQLRESAPRRANPPYVSHM